MTGKIQKRLEQLLRENVLLCDGALGTWLFAHGVSPSGCLEELNLSSPHLVRQVHEEYLAVGAEVLETNTFGANAVRLRSHGLEHRVAEINHAAVRLARDVAGRQAFVAGSVGPLGSSAFEPLPASEVQSVFRQQITALAEAGADFLLLETFTSLPEVRHAAFAARSATDLPVVVQLALNEHGNLPDGTPPERFVPELEACGVAALGCNCGAGPRATLAAIRRLASCCSLPLTAQPSAGLPQDNVAAHYPVSPDSFASFVPEFVATGVRLLGGCCGTTPEHIVALRAALSDLHAPIVSTERPS